MITEERVMTLLAECNPVPDAAALDLSADLPTTRLAELNTRSREMTEFQSEHSATTPASGRHRLILGTAAMAIVIAAVVLLRATDTTPVSGVVAEAEPQSRSAPSARGRHGMVELGGAGVLLVGGTPLDAEVRDGGGPPPSNSAWIFASEGRRDLKRDEVAPWFVDEPIHGIAFDSRSGLAVVTIRHGTFTYDPVANRIEQMAPQGPKQWEGGRMAYDAESDRTILFGLGDTGYGTYPDATWAYNVHTDSWRQMSPPISPRARDFHVMAYDPEADRVIMYGGHGRDDTWAYDFNTDTWTELAPPGGPGPRDFSAMVYDPMGRRMILFGGETPLEGGRSVLQGDTWAYNYRTNTWTDLAPVLAPSPRAWHAMAHDADSGMIVLFGGGGTNESWLSDTWIYDPAANVWSTVESPVGGP